MATFIQQVTVRPEDIDALGHVNNVVYLGWIQDIARAHWIHATTAAERGERVWVVTRHEIDYHRPTFAGDRLVLETWVEATTAVVSTRRVLIRREGEAHAVVDARTTWAALHPGTGRPTRIPPGYMDRFAKTPERP